MLFPIMAKVLTYSACEEQDHYHCGRNPYGAVQVGVAFQHIEEVLAWVYSGDAAADNFVGVDIKGLLVEGEGPEVVFSRVGAAGWSR
jgi:cytochrome b